MRERPDRLLEGDRTFRAITSDALVELERGTTKEWWAIDVMALAALYAHAQIPTELDKALRKLARARQPDIRVSGQVDDIGQVNKLIAAVEAEAHPCSTGSVEHGSAKAKWQPANPGLGGDLDLTIMLPSPSPLLAEQIAATIREPLTKKITGQGARAIAAGCKAAVLLDGLGHAGIEQGTHWLPKCPDTYRQAVESVLKSVRDDHLDLVAYLDRDGTWHILHGAM